MKIPKWFKLELSLGSAIGGFVTVIAIPWLKWATITLLMIPSMKSDIDTIKAAVVPPAASAFPINQKFKNVVTNQGK